MTLVILMHVMNLNMIKLCNLQMIKQYYRGTKSSEIYVICETYSYMQGFYVLAI